MIHFIYLQNSQHIIKITIVPLNFQCGFQFTRIRLTFSPPIFLKVDLVYIFDVCKQESTVVQYDFVDRMSGCRLHCELQCRKDHIACHLSGKLDTFYITDYSRLLYDNINFVGVNTRKKYTIMFCRTCCGHFTNRFGIYCAFDMTIYV